MDMTPISFMTANFVARQLGYQMTRGWGQGDQATNDYFRPLEHFGDRFEELLETIAAMGFEAIDLWQAHLNASWATAEHIAIAQELLAKYGLAVVSFAGWFGSTLEEFAATCQLAVALNCPILGGSTSVLSKDRHFVLAALKEHNLRLGLENHPESPTELLEKIGDGGEGRIGATVDTGWFGTQGYDAAEAIATLQDHLVHIHLKDVLAPTQPNEHITCRYGLGIVPLERCIRVLQEVGYAGGISIEHEPELYDPTEDVEEGLIMVKRWLGVKR
jgi:sugar phosphate isomerase/epimerase